MPEPVQLLGGLLDEAHALRQQGVHKLQNPATRALGYRQAFDWLQRISEARTATPADVRQLVHDIAGPSRRLHKAQLTFHRDLEQFRWVDARDGAEAAADEIEAQFLRDEHEGELKTRDVRLHQAATDVRESVQHTSASLSQHDQHLASMRTLHSPVFDCALKLFSEARVSL